LLANDGFVCAHIYCPILAPLVAASKQAADA